MMEGDVQPGSTPLKDLFDQLSQGQSRVTFAQVKVLSCLLLAGLCLPGMHHFADHAWHRMKGFDSNRVEGPDACLAVARLCELVV